mmetsp:Transcript_111524/g.355958  ORF Transcript_111524/g.355958 Transcript_111524/m.355958 type:complete len:243 (-) Transcript_111524:125-853(-)
MAVTLGLAAAKQILLADCSLRKGDWSARGIPADGDPDPLPQLSLSHCTALVLGYGSIGRRIGRVMRALDARVFATRRTARPGGSVEDDGVVVHPSGEMFAILPSVNLLFVCVPDAEDTAGLLGERELALLPRGSVLVNVGRGAVVDEGALFKSLQSGRLMAAGVDCWYNYPVDAAGRVSTHVSKRYEFHTLPNLIMSPHRAGAVGTAHVESSRMQHLAETCNAAVQRGVDAMPNRVSLAKGY